MSASQSETMLEALRVASLSVRSTWTCAVFAAAVLGCGGADGSSSPSEMAASEKASEAQPAQPGKDMTGAASAGSQAAPTKNANAAAGSSSNVGPNKAAGSGAVVMMMQRPATGAAGTSTAGSAGDQSQATAGASGGGSMGSSGTGSASAMSSCDRACLTGFNDAYLAALIAKDATKLKTAAQVRFTENGKMLQLTEGLWAVARELGPYRQDMAEVPAGQTAGFVSLQDDGGDVLLAFRLKVVNMEVTEIETTVCRTGEATFFSPDALMRNPLYDEEIAADARMDREALIAIVDSYFAGIESSDGSKIPFADSARRNENGTTTGMGTGLQNVAMFSYIDKIDRRYALVDVERGNVLPWVLFQIPMGLTGSRTLHLAELFKVDAGKIMDVQAIMVNQPLGTPGGWE